MKKRNFALVAALFLFAWGMTHAAFAKQNNLVRVLLTAHGKTAEMKVGVFGGYSVTPGMTFQRACEVFLTAENGELILRYEGMTINVGKTAVFTRHQAREGQENGLRLNGGLHLHEGDLRVSVKDGVIWPVLHLDIEDYLKGVVPYEMNDAFPKEALKAQAVAARSYAIGHLNPARDYDVVDNTNDQVYRGALSEHRNAHAAVLETAGEYALWQGAVARCYYTASNGGQTASALTVWGKEDIAYLQVKTDEYDFKNPESPLRTADIPKDFKLLPKDAPLFSALYARLPDALRARGMNDAFGSFRIDGIAAARAAHPRGGKDSLVMTELHLDVKVSAQRRANTADDGEVSLFSDAPVTEAPKAEGKWLPMQPVSEPISLSIPMFPDAEALLDLSINRAENEIIRVEDMGDRFAVTARRYGHGVGMSQRGAQQMAAEGKSYRDILQFYYPKVSIERRSAAPVSLPAPLDERYLITPGPVPSATPRPTLMPLSIAKEKGQWYAVVSGIAESSTLNLRAEPSLSAKVLMQMYYHQRLLVLESTGTGWLHVKADAAEGYVMEKFVEKE